MSALRRSRPTDSPATAQRRGRYRGVFFATLLLSVPAVSFGNNDAHRDALTTPVPTGNRSPFALIQGLPEAAPPSLTDTGRSWIALHADIANTSIVERSQSGRETTIDGETHRIAVDLRHGIGKGWEMGLLLPLLRHSGGILDQPIENWHGLFELPNGNRDRLPRNRLLFSQSSPGTPGYRLDSAGGGIGDLQLSLARQLGDGLALRSVLKLPTGDSDRLTGSGAAALAASLHGGGRLGDALTWHASGGLQLAGKGNVLAEARETLVAFGSATLAWRAGRSLVLKAQLDGHSAAYTGVGSPLDRSTLQLSIGAALPLSTGWVVDIGFSEDIAVETAPDIVFHAGLKHHF